MIIQIFWMFQAAGRRMERKYRSFQKDFFLYTWPSHCNYRYEVLTLLCYSSLIYSSYAFKMIFLRCFYSVLIRTAVLIICVSCNRYTQGTKSMSLYQLTYELKIDMPYECQNSIGRRGTGIVYCTNITQIW
jgi:hypothetical protein